MFRLKKKKKKARLIENRCFGNFLESSPFPPPRSSMEKKLDAREYSRNIEWLFAFLPTVSPPLMKWTEAEIPAGFSIPCTRGSLARARITKWKNVFSALSEGQGIPGF